MIFAFNRMSEGVNVSEKHRYFSFLTLLTWKCKSKACLLMRVSKEYYMIYLRGGEEGLGVVFSANRAKSVKLHRWTPKKSIPTPLSIIRRELRCMGEQGETESLPTGKANIPYVVTIYIMAIRRFTF